MEAFSQLSLKCQHKSTDIQCQVLFVLFVLSSFRHFSASPFLRRRFPSDFCALRDVNADEYFSSVGCGSPAEVGSGGAGGAAWWCGAFPAVGMVSCLPAYRNTEKSKLIKRRRSSCKQLLNYHPILCLYHDFYLVRIICSYTFGIFSKCSIIAEQEDALWLPTAKWACQFWWTIFGCPALVLFRR